MRAFQIIFKTTAGAVVMFAALSAVSQAAAPTALNYQGRLTDAGGTPVSDGNYSVVFAIYDAASGGTSKWTETQSVTTTGGLFAVLLGTVTPVTDSVFNGSTRYLGIKVGTDPEIVPRTRLVTAPYAFRISTVDGSTGGAISGNISLDASTATTGNILKGGVRFIHNVGSSNTCIGGNAGNLAMSGSSNTACGTAALQNITNGSDNTATGASALANAAGGQSNTACGAFALEANSGNQNTACGVSALSFNTSGGANTAVGVGALISNTTASQNTATGIEALFSNTSGLNNTATGAAALFSNTTGLSNTAGGEATLHSNTNGSDNTAFGDSALYGNTGSNNTAGGYRALSNNTTGSNNTAIGYDADAATGGLTNATAIGYGATVNASNKIRLGNAAVTVIEGQVAYTFTSDRNQKENFQSVDGDDVLRKIRGLSLTSWNYKKQDPSKFRHYGPVAQEFFAAFGHDPVGQIGDSISINSGDETGILMVAVQTLEKRTAEVAQVKAENAELKARLEKVEAALSKLAESVPAPNRQLAVK